MGKGKEVSIEKKMTRNDVMLASDLPHKHT